MNSPFLRLSGDSVRNAVFRLYCRRWFAAGGFDCSGRGICVTSLNMRKWMRDRLQRRKKKATEKSDQPAPPPLQPAYFDENQAGASEASGDDAPVSHETSFEVQPENDDLANVPPRVESANESSEGEPDSYAPASTEPADEPVRQPSRSSASKDGSRGRGRRRRGGRGRGGRGREQAVAQAFAPAAAQTISPDAPPEAPPETEPAAAVRAVPVTTQRPPKGLVVLAIGLPGSGKSSWFKRHNVVPLSSDMVRSLLFDDVREQRFQDLVFSNLRSMLKARLIAKRPTNYVDATNLTPQERQHWIKLAKDYNYEVHAVFFDVPLEVCIERHHRRDRVVPEDVMRRMAAKLKPPAFDEGFAKITVVRVKKKEGQKEEE
jgi:predicted kinase